MDKVLIELVVSANIVGAGLFATAEELVPGVRIDRQYEPVQIEPRPEDESLIGEGQKVVVIRGDIESDKRPGIEDHPRVLHIWSDARVEPFQVQ